MQKVQAHNIVRETLQNDFDKDRFVYFVKNLLNKIDETKTFKCTGTYIPEAFRPFVKSYERIGQYIDSENNKIDILIVYLQKETSLDRARTAQRNFIARYLKDRDQKDAGLIAFVSPDSVDWRFSLVKMEYKFEEGKNGRAKIKEEFTPAKRWSFLVGKVENSHTAQSRLVPIMENDQINPVLKQLEDAFNIEKVTKEFFEKYRELFLRVYETLNYVIEKHPNIKNDFINKNVNTADFSKKLLGQIVFLYFLQKKGWFGVPMTKSWGDGDKKFLRTLFIQAGDANKNYFNDYLEPLFYEALAKERDDDFYSRFECKIPFLNGGLFDPISNYDWVNTNIDFPDDIFSNTRKTKDGDIGDGILDIFDRYNFTVKEDEPLEKEVAIDPEMLGKVFENLLEVKDRKSKGTYYTPREIVHYMCEQSVVNYLTTELEDKISKEDLECIIRIGENVIEHEATHIAKKASDPDYKGSYDQTLPPSIEKFAKEIDDKLATIKICDPAIGSGAFPVGMMSTIVKARMVLSNYLIDKNRTLYTFKRDCIQNSLYGVDIDPGAVEIAKLRLWLSLVVDEDDIKKIKPLPNLDYKIMQGNSLLEEFEGIKLFDEKIITVIDVDKEKQIESLKQKQTVLQKEYFVLHSQSKLTSTKQAELNSDLKRISTQLKKLNQPEMATKENSGLFDVYSDAKKKGDMLKSLHKEFFESTQKSKKDSIKKHIEQLEWELIEATLKEQNKVSALKKLEEFKQSNTKPFFLWKLNFADVFEEKGGFDVVIGNPPYVQIQKFKGQSIQEDLQKEKYITYSKTGDLYCLFYEKGLSLSKESTGLLCYITSNKWMRADYGENLREYLSKLNPLILLDLGSGVFESATVDSNILLIRNSINKNKTLALTVRNNKQSFEDQVNKLAFTLSFNTSDIWFITTPTERELKNKIESMGVPLKKWEIVINKGLMTGCNEAFYIDEAKKNEIENMDSKSSDLIFKNFRGREICKYFTPTRDDSYVIVVSDRVDIDNYPAIKRHLENFHEKLEARAQFIRGDHDWYAVDNCPSEDNLQKYRHTKIVYPNMTQKLVFSIDKSGSFSNDKTFTIISSDEVVKYLCGLLNSKTLNFYLKRSLPKLGNDGYEIRKVFFEKTPIPEINKDNHPKVLMIDSLVDKIYECKQNDENPDISEMESKIDELVMNLYGLNEYEKEIIRNS